MKAKTNLELFKNEIGYTCKNTSDGLYTIMKDIFKRETGKESIDIFDMLDRLSDVPRETLEVTAEMYSFLKAYVKDELVCDEMPLDYSLCTNVLINIGIIPKKYSKWSLKNLLKLSE